MRASRVFLGATLLSLVAHGAAVLSLGASPSARPWLRPPPTDTRAGELARGTSFDVSREPAPAPTPAPTAAPTEASPSAPAAPPTLASTPSKSPRPREPNSPAAAAQPPLAHGAPETAPEPGTGAPGTTAGATQAGPASLGASEAQPSAPSSYGGLGFDIRERRLPRALARALPVATTGEAGWWEGEVGTRGRARFCLELSAEGRVEAWKLREPAPPPMLQRLLERVGRLLVAGRFAVTADGPAQPQCFELRAALRQGQGSELARSERGDVIGVSYEAPSPNAPGSATLREAGGRELWFELLVVPDGRAPAAPSMSESSR